MQAPERLPEKRKAQYGDGSRVMGLQPGLGKECQQEQAEQPKIKRVPALVPDHPRCHDKAK